MEESYQYVNLLEAIIKALVEDTDAVKIKRSVDDRGVLLLITAAQPDIKHIIGREGKTINILRGLFHVLGARENARLSLKVVDHEE